MPWIIIAPTISAMMALPGMPRVSSGMKLVCAPALLAASGAATPSIAPRPKRSGLRAEHRADRGAAQHGRDALPDLGPARPQLPHLERQQAAVLRLAERDRELG